MEKNAGDVSSAVESSLYQCVHAMLRELDTHSQASGKGMLRWTLHKKVENNPATCISLLRVLVKELEKAERTDGKIRIIPLLHTLVYTVMQSVYIPDDLCERVYVCLKRMLTLPEPYCTVGLHYAKHIKIEQNIPGILYQRRVIAEHSLKNEHYPLHERVFVFVDPAVFPETLLDAVKADVECGALDWDTLSYQRRVLLHTLQAAVGKQCHGTQLAQALEELGEDVQNYFQDIVAIVEGQILDGSLDFEQYTEAMQKIYQEIIASASTGSPANFTGAPLPSPEIRFNVWTKEDDIWNAMINFTLMVSSTEQNSTFLNEDEVAKRASVISTISRDSGFEGDLPLNEFSYLLLEPPAGPEAQDQQKTGQFSRRPCVRWPKAGNRLTLMMEAMKESGGTGGCGGSLPKEGKNFTARIVVMGDDRTLGRLCKAFYSIRKKEVRHLFLTKRVNLETYYIPVTSQSGTTSPDQDLEPTADMLTMAAFLGRLDPWYDCNINSLGSMILKLAETHSGVGGSSEPNSFLLDIISYYTRTAQQPVHIPIYSVKIFFSALESKPVEEMFVCQLDMNFLGLRPLRATFKDTIKGSVRYKRSTQEHTGVVVAVNSKKASISSRGEDRDMCLMTCGVLIRADPASGTKNLESLSVDFREPNPSRFSVSPLRVTSISIRILEERTCTLCLDKDSSRTFTNVQSIEVSRCMDPGYCLQKKPGQSQEVDDAGLSKYLSKTFTLPINTFCGAVQ
ncbi:phosphoinositide 3-kinase regulatory subunit 6 [Trichomycterus rosablanca]|uniref:phosphoinositide 3-kinase regulatory subunit 6 n=1 Tax=Trichomycterus rosablanca TaxID=2290929 RepID=UPI002F3548D4